MTAAGHAPTKKGLYAYQKGVLSAQVGTVRACPGNRTTSGGYSHRKEVTGNRFPKSNKLVELIALAELALNSLPRLVRTRRDRDDSGAIWMHCLLALKFAAWLDAYFEVWVYRTIEQVLFAHGQRLGEEVREKARLLDRRDEIRHELQGNTLFQEHQTIEFKLR